MKQKFFIAAFLMLFIAAGFAFSPQPTGLKPTAGELWFEYDGTGDVAEPTNYVLYGDGTISPNCPDGNNRCAIKAQPQTADPSLPEMSTIIETLNRP